jgi:hypothetical protein
MEEAAPVGTTEIVPAPAAITVAIVLGRAETMAAIVRDPVAEAQDVRSRSLRAPRVRIHLVRRVQVVRSQVAQVVHRNGAVHRRIVLRIISVPRIATRCAATT